MAYVELPTYSSFINPAAYGATGNGVTDDRAAIQAAVNAAISTNRDIVFTTPGTYNISAYIDVASARGLTIKGGSGVIVRFPSASGTTPDATANTAANPPTAMQSAFYLRYCTGVNISGIVFQGDDNQNVFSNIGCAVYARKCVALKLDNCTMMSGGSLIAQEANTNTIGTGDSLTLSGSTITLSSASGGLTAGHVGRYVTVANATNAANNGTFRIVSVPSATSLTYTNAGGASETTAALKWTVDDADRDTRVSHCSSYGARTASYVAPDSVYDGCHFELPAIPDLTGQGDALSFSGGVVTLTDAGLPDRQLGHLVGHYITIAGATTPANNGTFKLTSVTERSLTTPATFTFANASGATEAFTGTWWIAGGEKSGLGNGAAALAKSVNTMTLTATAASFVAADIGKVIRIAGPTTAANGGAFVITAVPSSTTCQFTNAAGVAEAYSGIWSIESYDHAKDASQNTYGSSHAIYLFAGRSNVKVVNCTFRNIRADCVKVSGSGAPMRDILIEGCTAIECSALVVAGADDSQEHTGITVVDNDLLDCATQRPGWAETNGIWILGARNVVIRDNRFHYSRNAISAVDGRNTVNTNISITASRYLAGISQPLEDLRIEGNKFTADPAQTTANNIVAVNISTSQVGIRARWRTGGTLTKSGSTMTLTDGSATFHQEMVGQAIELVNCATGGNNGTFTVLTVTGTGTLTYANAAGASEAAGTYRCQAVKKGGAYSISGNQFVHSGAAGITALNGVAPQIVDNMFMGMASEIDASGSMEPYIDRNVTAGRTTLLAGIRLDTGTSWPLVGKNPIVGGGAALLTTKTIRGDLPVGVDSSTAIDHPLLGFKGKAKPTDAKEEIVIAYGSNWVDGDFFNINGGAKYTYKASAPGARQFNTMAGLAALIVADGFACADYGSFFTSAVATGHLRIRRNVTSSTDSNFSVDTFNVLNPTACVVLRNATGGGEAYAASRGCGSAGPTADKIVVWSPACTQTGSVQLVPDNASAMTILAASYYRHVKAAGDAACCDILQTGTTAGTEEFRWTLS